MATIEETFEVLRSNFRTPIIAEIGGFEPTEDPRSSWFGAGCALPGEKLPADGGHTMFPLLQINCEELPRKVGAFGDAKLLVVYMSNEEVPFNKSHGDGWEIREYPSLNGLALVSTPKPETLEPFPIRWKVGEAECPGWEESWEIVDMTPINSSEDAGEVFHDLPHHGYTKIGGYPTETALSEKTFKTDLH